MINLGKLSEWCRNADAACLLARSSLSVFDGDLAEEETARLATGPHADAEIQSHELANGCEVDGEFAQQWCVVPDVAERQTGELAAPHDRHRTAAQRRQEFVAAVEPAGEARVAASPHAVDRPDAFGLSQDLLETHLDVRVEVIRVPVFHVRLILSHRHPDSRFSVSTRQDLSSL